MVRMEPTEVHGPTLGHYYTCTGWWKAGKESAYTVKPYMSAAINFFFGGREFEL